MICLETQTPWFVQPEIHLWLICTRLISKWTGCGFIRCLIFVHHVAPFHFHFLIFTCKLDQVWVLIIMEEEKRLMNSTPSTLPQRWQHLKKTLRPVLLARFVFYLFSFAATHSLYTLSFEPSSCKYHPKYAFYYRLYSYITSLFWFVSIHVGLLFCTSDIWPTLCPYTSEQTKSAEKTTRESVVCTERISFLLLLMTNRQGCF